MICKHYEQEEEQLEDRDVGVGLGKRCIGLAAMKIRGDKRMKWQKMEYLNCQIKDYNEDIAFYLILLYMCQWQQWPSLNCNRKSSESSSEVTFIRRHN